LQVAENQKTSKALIEEQMEKTNSLMTKVESISGGFDVKEFVPNNKSLTNKQVLLFILIFFHYTNYINFSRILFYLIVGI